MFSTVQNKFLRINVVQIPLERFTLFIFFEFHSRGKVIYWRLLSTVPVRLDLVSKSVRRTWTRVSVYISLYFHLKQKKSFYNQNVNHTYIYGFHSKIIIWKKSLYGKKPCDFETFCYVINCAILRRERK